MPELNEQQEAVVDFVVNEGGSLNVIARAGTGKTFTLINGVVVAITANKLGSVALMAFNKSAATEFEQRIERLANESNLSDLFLVNTGTVHSFGFRFWRKVAGQVKVDGYKVANLVQSLTGSTRSEPYPFQSQVTKLVSLAKQSAYTPEDLLLNGADLIAHFDIDANGSSDEIIDKAVEVLAASNKMRNTIDFDDMIYLPVINKVNVDQFDFVLIDEAQDTNATRRQLAFMMMKPTGRMIAVGDDRQAIYGFTGANSDSLELIRQALNSTELPLTITYRCPKAVVAEANRIVPDLIAHETAPEGKVRTINAMVERN